MFENELSELETKMKLVVAAFRRRLATVRTGRASATVVEDLTIDAYGSTMPMREVAAVSAPERRLLVIQPYDASLLKAIEKALKQTEMGSDSHNDGRLIRINFPAQPYERRRELVKQISVWMNESEAALRSLQRDMLDHARGLLRANVITEEQHGAAVDATAKLKNRCVSELNSATTEKEKEINEP